MLIVAEIADKMPSALALAVVCVIAAIPSVVLALAHRLIAWGVLLLVLLGGVFFALPGYQVSFTEGASFDAVWSELGWTWVAANIVGPLLPCIAVATLMILRRPTADEMTRFRPLEDATK